MPYGHGKVILFGEHGVVYGHPAIAVAVGRGAEVRWQPMADGGLTTLHVDPWNIDVDLGAAQNPELEDVREMLRLACAYDGGSGALSLHAEMRLPGRAGMGSSAALGVAVLRALDEARGLTHDAAELYRRSLALEGVFHGTPSGIDSAMAVYGGISMFTKRDGKEPLLSPIVARHAPRLVAADSGSRPPAKEMVAAIRRKREAQPANIDKTFEAIAAIVANGKVALEQGDLKGLGQLMTMNHLLLAGLMLSNSTLEAMIRAAMDAGALGAKVTGAGGGGCMIALVDGDEAHASVKAALSGLGKTVYEVESG